MYLPNVPCHVITRGNNRNACFFSDYDRHFYLDCLNDACTRYQVQTHTYVLMTNHVHLLLTPADSDGVSRVMQSIGRLYVQHINKTYQRSGTLFESRNKASLVDAENYLLAIYRYMELNPVRAGMVEHPGDYLWSGYAANAWGRFDRCVQPHVVFQRLGSDEERGQNYRDLFNAAIDANQLHDIRNALQFSLPTGNSRFAKQIEQALGRRIRSTTRGGPFQRRKYE
jgi:putative transposase